MAIIALNSAATGLRALSTKLDVIANNLANSETTAFKTSRVNFEELVYQTIKEPGTSNAAGDLSPAGTFVGLGVKVSNTQLNLDQGTMESTDRPLDVAIVGTGFFRVKIMPGIGDGYGYTRAGNFFVNKDQQLVLGMGDGYRLDPVITIPPTATSITVSNDGLVDYLVPGQITRQQAGTIKLANFINPNGLTLLGGNIYLQTESSGPAALSDPGKDGIGTLQQSYLEGSNVDPVKELVSLIKTQRAFELNSQSIQAADEALQTIGNMRRN
ncbi:MAG: flagellar basal-body rod protein FlgG [Tepidisphaeraceae bacterium]|jgi:flagellar basal-body rod protein FlgG